MQNLYEHIEIIPTGDLFQSGMQTIINPINCTGVMGAGLAKLFKTKYPDMFLNYQQRCHQGLVKPGIPYTWQIPNSSNYILNFPTKNDWRNKSQLKDIQDGLHYIARHAKTWGITSLAIPALGCGLGGLKWSDVLPDIIDILGPLNIPIKIYQEGPKLEKRSAYRNKKTREEMEVVTSVIPDSIFTKKQRVTLRPNKLNELLLPPSPQNG